MTPEQLHKALESTCSMFAICSPLLESSASASETSARPQEVLARPQGVLARPQRVLQRPSAKAHNIHCCSLLQLLCPQNQQAPRGAAAQGAAPPGADAGPFLEKLTHYYLQCSPRTSAHKYMIFPPPPFEGPWNFGPPPDFGAGPDPGMNPEICKSPGPTLYNHSDSSGHAISRSSSLTSCQTATCRFLNTKLESAANANVGPADFDCTAGITAAGGGFICPCHGRTGAGGGFALQEDMSALNLEMPWECKLSGRTNASTVEARKLEHGFRRISATIPYTLPGTLP